MPGKRVREEEYAKIKALIACDLDDSTIANTIKRSRNVIRAIRDSKSYEEYKHIMKALAGKAPKRVTYTQPTLNIEPKTKDVAEVAKIKAKELVDELKVWRSIQKNRRNALALLKAEEALMWLNYTGGDVA